MKVQTEHQRRRQSFTLEKAVGVALLLHLLAGALLTWWPGLLMPAEATPAAEPPPLQFRFVDTPESEPPPEPPDTEDLSDIDRQVADASERDDQDTPFSEGNTSQTVIRLPQEAAETLAADQPTPVAPQPEVSEADPVAEESPAEPIPRAETGDLAPSEKPAETNVTAKPETPQPRVAPRRGLRNSLARLEAYVDPQLFDNPRGGAPERRNLAQFNTRGFDLGGYLQEVLFIIERNWRSSMPPLIQTGIGGATFLALSIRRQRLPDGREVAIIVAERTWSSGQPAYDSAAHFSFELSNPLPPIPDFYPHDTIEGRLGFLYNIDPDEVDFPGQ